MSDLFKHEKTLGKAINDKSLVSRLSRRIIRSRTTRHVSRISRETGAELLFPPPPRVMIDRSRESHERDPSQADGNRFDKWLAILATRTITNRNEIVN